MKITYIHHSAFLVETASCTLLFDYYKGNLPEIDPSRPLYVLVSHAHSDHYVKSVFGLLNKAEHVQFILSHDIPRGDVPASCAEHVVFLKPRAHYEDDILQLGTLLSNDEGVAFVLQVKDGDAQKRIYFAGDLNNWNWDGDAEDMELIRIYHGELEHIRGDHADVAFIPLDPRLKENFYLGIDDYFRYADADVVFPMHFWKEHDVTARLRALPACAAYADRVVAISREGEQFTV